MEIIQKTMSQTKEEKINLLSVNEQKVLEKTFQFVISLAVLPYLLPGVGVSLERKCRHFENVKSENLTNFTVRLDGLYTLPRKHVVITFFSF